jgi:hypothetical protein
MPAGLQPALSPSCYWTRRPGWGVGPSPVAITWRIAAAVIPCPNRDAGDAWRNWGRGAATGQTCRIAVKRRPSSRARITAPGRSVGNWAANGPAPPGSRPGGDGHVGGDGRPCARGARGTTPGGATMQAESGRDENARQTRADQLASTHKNGWKSAAQSAALRTRFGAV